MVRGSPTEGTSAVSRRKRSHSTANVRTGHYWGIAWASQSGASSQCLRDASKSEGFLTSCKGRRFGQAGSDLSLF